MSYWTSTPIYYALLTEWDQARPFLVPPQPPRVRPYVGWFQRPQDRW